MSPTSTAPLRMPGDKSIAHRALLCAGLADTPSVVANVPDGDDVHRTVDALAALGVTTQWTDAHTVRITPAPWTRPSHPIDCGNSGTLARLLMGALAGQRIEATLVGDASLSSRPMRRVAQPLDALLGAPAVELTPAGTLPACTRADLPLRRGPAVVATGAPSAQVKSALLFASCAIEGDVRVTEAVPTRDHTERMLGALGVAVRTAPGEVEVRGPLRWRGFDLEVPGDPSSAAFLVVAAAASGRPLSVEDMALNARRLGFFRVVGTMGVRASTRVRALRLGEDVGTLDVWPGQGSALVGAAVPSAEVPDLIDEVPALVGLALLAQGRTSIPGLAELRVKESDRLARLVELAAAFGGSAHIDGDAMCVTAPACARGRVAIRTDGDHRIAMTAHVLGRVLGADVALDAPGCERTSYPGFLDALDRVVHAS